MCSSDLLQNGAGEPLWRSLAAVDAYRARFDAPPETLTNAVLLGSLLVPLGYNIRPRRLQAIAREAVASHGGQLPDDEATLLSFKGIGPYTAGAIQAFAFRKRAAILDTNVARVLFRVFVAKGDHRGHTMDKFLWEIGRAHV